ncbi:AraC-like DNA-binding protein [Nonomuraea thailandensis]|uniref:AraC-like DNA-binding protein n=1 Tax=Nonomuraea thailandensis TaxID=1188745 RepID=A0A9X2GGC4_9ACTN|nr:helix-turn-helix domain-containing protein [Nonomuraea thailandensis]MCP2357162.1 AraC-like DNA-binding protein [Nonomuraea thailandensis]
MLLFETDDIPPADRVDAYREAAVAETGSCAIDHEPGPDGHVNKRIEAWHFDPFALYHTSGSGFRYWQTARHLRMDSWNTISIITVPAGKGGFIWNDHQQAMTPRDLTITNKSAGYWEVNWSGTGATLCLLADAAHVGPPDSMIHTAVPHIPHSPITPLLLNHMQALHRAGDHAAGGASANDLGQATLSLVRALVASVGAPSSTRRAIADETRLVRVLAYIRAHLTDPELAPARITAAHNISLRSLYRLCEDGGLSLEQWIIRRRLDGAHRDLTAPEHAHRTIDAIARTWGFTSPAHFARRFRQAYGSTPRTWRAASAPNTGD